MKQLCLLLAAMFLLGGANTPGIRTDIAVEKAGVDLMLVVTHPGDEYLYLGGVLPEYVSKRRYTAVVVYMTSADETQRREAAASLRALGVSREPVFAGLPDVFSDSMDIIRNWWSDDDAVRFLVRTIRQYRPAIIVSHDRRGEYGSATHRLTAKYVERAVPLAAGTRSDKESFAEFGSWQTCRAFLHLAKEDATVSIDREVPLSAFAGRTALAVEEDLYASFSEAYRYPLDVGDPVYGRADYGLVYADPDLGSLPRSDDFFYGIDASLLNGPCAPGVLAADRLSQDVRQDVPDEDSYYRRADDPAEVIVENWENEHWEYRTDTLSVIIDRYHGIDAENKPIAYCVAHVRMRAESSFRAALRGEDGGKRSYEVPVEMARRYQAVLAVTGDNLSISETEWKGIIIRRGKVYNRQKGADTLALMPDLSLRIYSPGETTAEELLAMGVTDAYSFGPTLIRDGVVNINATRPKIAGRNPRAGIGMIEPGHLVVVTFDGRMPNYSHGATLNTFMQLFYSLGCKQAYNLDGGSSTAMVFMGEYLNRHSELEGGIQGQRDLPDMLLWGKSDRVPSVDDPVHQDVYKAVATPKP